MRPIMTILLAVAAGCATAAATAGEAPGTVYRLSPDEIAQVAPNPPPRDPALAYDPLFDRSLFDPATAGPRRDRRPHGEVGAFVGSGGARGAFGTVGVPIGDDGFAAFSFEDSSFGRRYGRR